MRACATSAAPSSTLGPYRLPHDVRDRLQAALSPCRNRDAALGLAVFLERYWSAPGRLTTAFAIDRRELADHAALDLRRVLEDASFLDRAVLGGRTHKLTDGGELHRRPIKYQFGSDYVVLFGVANNRVIGKVAAFGTADLAGFSYGAGGDVRRPKVGRAWVRENDTPTSVFLRQRTLAERGPPEQLRMIWKWSGSAPPSGTRSLAPIAEMSFTMQSTVPPSWTICAGASVGTLAEALGFITRA